MQTYYEKITSAVLRPDPGVRRIAYGSLRADPGLHQLVPYLVQFVADKVRGHARGKMKERGRSLTQMCCHLGCTCSLLTRSPST